MERSQTTKRNAFQPIAKFKTYKLKNYNFRLVLYLLVLAGLGVAIVGSANSGDTSAISKQLLGVIIGVVGMVIISLIDYSWILKFNWVIYFINAGLLIAVLLFGKNLNGATRWLAPPGSLGDYITIQPSEFAKIFIIVFLAKFLSAHKERISKWLFMAYFAVVIAVPLALILKEPDLSTTLLITMVIVSTYFCAGLSYKKIAIILAITIPVITGALLYVISHPDSELLDTYQRNRIMSFIYPDEYDDLRYQQDNSVLAIGSGKLTGKGLYNDSVDSMKNGSYLSAQAINDFIFAIIGEELGFVGSCVIIGLIFLIVAECFITGITAPDLSGRLICISMGMLLVFQTFINVGVATEILPNTGIPLPYVSSGLSSLISLFGGMGFVLNVSLQKKTN